MEVEVLDKGKPGILGIGAEEARVLVRWLGVAGEEGGEVDSLAREVLEKLLTLMSVSARVSGRTVNPEAGSEGVPTLELDVRGDDLGILIGRRGETLAALQHTVNLIVGRQLKTRVSVAVDVEGYQKRREQSLRSLAERMAERVKSSGQTATLEPMSAKERRIIHLALSDDPDVTTESVGTGEGRKVTISLKRTR